MVTEGRTHTYHATVRWTGNLGEGTAGYRSYSRDHDIVQTGKPTFAGSSDPAFAGDPSRHNPEDMLIASLSACHMLWYLHLCSRSGIVVIAYSDEATATMDAAAEGGGRFVAAVLRPSVRLAPGSDRDLAIRLHDAAHRKCFIANSVNFPVTHQPRIEIGDGPDAPAPGADSREPRT